MKKSIVFPFHFPILLPVLAFFFALQSANAQWDPGTSPTFHTTLDATHVNSKVGIGLTTPTQRLHLSNGNMLFDYSDVAATTGSLFFGNPIYGTGAGTKGMRLFFRNGASGTTLGGYIDVRVPTSSNDGLIFRVDNSNGGIERMRICSNGRVGIGTNNPGARFEVKTGSIMTSNPTSGDDGILFRNSGGTATVADWGLQYWQNTVHPGEPAGLNFWKPFGATAGSFANYILYLQDDGKIKMGEVGSTVTGQPNNNFRLFVKDGIVTEKVLVSTFGASNWNWPDYVFAPEHKLRSLEEVEAFVQKEKHLPNVPSAAEVNEHGVELGQMSATLLEKIEELTLYVVELNKRLKTLEQENQALKTQTPAPATNANTTNAQPTPSVKQ